MKLTLHGQVSSPINKEREKLEVKSQICMIGIYMNKHSKPNCQDKREEREKTPSYCMKIL